MTSLRGRPAGEPLFGPWARGVAEAQGRDAAFRWLALADDGEARCLRAALQQGFAAAGRSADVLAKGLAHERWGQHAGARAHLLTLALLSSRRLSVENEPALGHKSPDLLVAAHGQRLLLEVRALTGRGEAPWERKDAPPGSGDGQRVLPIRKSSKAALEKELRRRRKQAAVARAAADAKDSQGLSRSAADAVSAKVDSYAALCHELDLPLAVIVYEDTDHQLAEILGQWALGDGSEPGAWQRRRNRFAALSAVFVLGRDVGPDGECLLRGELLINPSATRRLPANLLPAHLPPTTVAPTPLG